MPAFPDPDDRAVLLPGCARCPGLAACRERIAWGNGPTDASVMVVGEAPAAGNPDADRWQGGNHTGQAYTSRHSGRRVRALFEDLGYDPYYTNAVKCFPSAGTAADSERGGGPASQDPATNREPTPAERRRCRVHLRTEIEAVAPEVVVATGKHATRSVLHLADRALDGFLDAVLDPVDCPELGVTVLPVLHPSYREVWLARLGYDEADYRAEIAGKLP